MPSEERPQYLDQAARFVCKTEFKDLDSPARERQRLIYSCKRPKAEFRFARMDFFDDESNVVTTARRYVSARW